MIVAGALFWASYRLLGPATVAAAQSIGDRLVLAMRCNAVAALTLLAGIHWVAGVRGVTAAIDPWLAPRAAASASATSITLSSS